MQTLSQMNDTELLAWAKAFIANQVSTTILKTETLTGKPGDYPPVSVDKFFAYGYQRFHNDGIGDGNTSIADKLANAKAKHAAALQGNVGRTRGEAVDPFMTIVLRIVKRMVKAKNAENYKNIMKGDKPDDVFKAILAKTQENKPDVYKAIMAEATEERKHQERKAAMLVTLASSVSTDDL